eukprot:gene17295-17485_t
MFSAYIIEIGEEAAGIIARDANAAPSARNQFHFYASSQVFFPLEGREFPSAAAAHRAAKALWQNWRNRKASAPASFAARAYKPGRSPNPASLRDIVQR